MNRRKFIKNTLAATPLILPTSISNSNPMILTSLKIKVLATNWGYSGSINEFCKKVKEDGYDGIEIWWPGDTSEQQKWFDALSLNKLEVGFLTGGSDPDFSKHELQFKKAVEEASQSKQRPLYINCHSGRDHFSFDQNSKLIQYTLDQSKATGLDILHETHRGRMCYSAPITRGFIEKYKDMGLTLDISHWTNVHESMLDDQQETIDLALRHTKHIHARIGHQEGPQVNDPRAPEWDYAVQKHMQWWDQVLKYREAAGATTMTFLTEFGPPHYLPALPYTQSPVADQWAINVFMLKTIKERYKSK